MLHCLCCLPYKRLGKSGDWVSEVQSVLCKEAVCLKRVIVIWRSPLERSVELLASNCYCLCKGYKKRNSYNKRQLLSLHQVVNDGTQGIVQIKKNFY